MMEPMIIRLLYGLFLSFLLTFYLVPLMCSIATKLNILDIPDGKVKQHKSPTPYLGGLAVYLGFIITLSLLYPFENQILFLLLGSTLLLFVGLIDDLLVIKPYQKLFGQSIVALCFLKAGFHIKEIFFLTHFWQIPLSFFWILLMINAFNLVDIMDGLATILALCATISFLSIALCLNQWSVALLLISFGGALLAFLYYNKPSAKIYLGDTGSLFIGGFLSTVPFLLHWSSCKSYGFIVPIIILAVPLLEVITLIVIRSYKKIPFYQASPDHFALYLKNKGWSTEDILFYTAAISLSFSLLAILFFFNIVPLLFLLIFTLFILYIWFFVLLYKKKCSSR